MVDAGDLFGRRNRNDKLQTEFLCEVTGSLGYDAIGLGERELNFGLPYFRRMIEQFGLPYTNANVSDPATGNLILPEYLIVERAGIRFGICSVMDPSHKFIAWSGDDVLLDVADPVTTMRELVPRLREKADTIILLAHLGDRGAEQLAREVSGIDAIVVGHTLRNHKTERVIADAAILAAAHEGRFIGRADVYIEPDDGKIMSIDVSITSLDETVADEPGMQQRVTDFQLRLEEAKLARRARYPRDRGSEHEQYLGEVSCKRCHEDIYEIYRQTPHRSAFNGLRSRGMNFEPECLSCHTTGYQYHNGYDEQHRTAKLSGVQCEACHGYGSEHSRDGKYATVARESCLECHDLQNSHHADDGYEFDYATYWEKIKH